MKVGDIVKITGNGSKVVYHGELMECRHFFDIGDTCVIKEILEGGVVYLEKSPSGFLSSRTQYVSINDIEIIEEDCSCCDKEDESQVVGVAILFLIVRT